MDERRRVVWVPLERVAGNPYQPREAEDAGHVREVAESIRRDGLLQVPAGRLLADGTVQLAFGHTRLAAFRLLAAEEGRQWGRMPVRLMDLDDERMFRLAVVENVKRRGLDAVETARALKRYMEEFGKTAAEAGALFGLSESAVRNKVRLLGLPDAVLEALRAMRVTEGAARLVLQVTGWPEPVREAVGVDDVVARWLESGGGEAVLVETVGEALRTSRVVPLELAREAVGGDEVVAPRCVECDWFVQWRGEGRCLGDFGCWMRKRWGVAVQSREGEGDEVEAPPAEGAPVVASSVSIETLGGSGGGEPGVSIETVCAVGDVEGGEEDDGGGQGVSIETATEMAETAAEPVDGMEAERALVEAVAGMLLAGDLAVWRIMASAAYPWRGPEVRRCEDVACVARVLVMGMLGGKLNHGGLPYTVEWLRAQGVEVVRDG